MDNLDEKIKQIKIHRKPECWLENIFMNLTAYTHICYPLWIFYKYQDELLFEYKPSDNYFYFDRDKIYFILKIKYNCHHDNIIKGIQININKYLKIKNCIFPYKDGHLPVYISENLEIIK